MVGKFSLFTATVQYNLLRFIPDKRQKLLECMQMLSEDIPEDLFCQDILEVWLECFGAEGLILGSLALFWLSILLMTGADLLIRRAGSPILAGLIRFFSGAFCLEKFRGGSSRQPQNLMLLFYISTCLLADFHWTITILFLIFFTNIAAYTAKGGGLC